jgi:hypothetical protein
MYEFDKGDLFIDIDDPGNHFHFDDVANTVFVTVGGILRFSVQKFVQGSVVKNVYSFYSADGDTVVTNTEFIDEGVINNG